MDDKADSLAIFNEIKSYIEQSKQQLAVSVNSTMSMLYWQIGKRINDEFLKSKRAEYGKQIIATLSDQLTSEYVKGWSEKQLRHCIRFADIFKENEIVYTLCRELSWSHLRVKWNSILAILKKMRLLKERIPR